MGLNVKMAKPPVFSRKASKVGRFITICKLYLRIRMRRATMDKQI